MFFVLTRLKHELVINWTIKSIYQFKKMSEILLLDIELSNEWLTKLKTHQLNTTRQHLKQLHLDYLLSLDTNYLKHKVNLLQNFPFPDNEDEEMMRRAMQHYAGVFPHLSSTLRSNREFALQGVKFNGKFLEFTSDELRNDREVVMEAICENAGALEFASDALKDDASIVEQAVEGQIPDVIKFASERLRDNVEMANLAVSWHAVAYCYISDRLQNDIDFAESCVGWARCSGRNHVLFYMPEHVRSYLENLYGTYYY